MRGDRELGIAKSVRSIEWLKAELIGGVASVFRAALQGGEEAISEALGGVIVTCYLLGKRLGVGFSKIDARIQDKLKLNIDQEHELEKWYGDLSAFLRHLDGKKG